MIVAPIPKIGKAILPVAGEPVFSLKSQGPDDLVFEQTNPCSNRKCTSPV
jgi:hypothetical protein